jgi:tRNA threonylcarbamoyladenosine biosynthesis protein TsaB
MIQPHTPLPLSLYLDTSSSFGTFTLLDHTGILISKTSESPMNHARVIHTEIEGMLAKLGIDWAQLNAVFVLNGPGSYTGLRIALSVAKGICFGLDIPLYLMTKFDLLAKQILREKQFSPFVVVQKAREHEFFAACYDSIGEVLLVPELYLTSELNAIIETKHANVYSDEQYEDDIVKQVHVQTVNPDDIKQVCYDLLNQKKIASLMESEPFYLKNVYINQINKL